MIFIKNTPNNTGVAIYGDYQDFENLYEALHTVVGNEDEFISYDAARIRILGLCYDIRHALMGDREIEFVDNGMDDEKKRRMSVLAPDKNVYLKIYALWPEMLFITMALNEFLKLYARKQTKASYSSDLLAHNKVIWDSAVAQVRLLQSAVAACLRETVSERVFARMMNVMNGRYVSFDGYIDQYLDLLNYRFINMGREKRLKNLSAMARRIAERDQEYWDLVSYLKEEAKEQNCTVDDLRLDLDFPDHIEW